MKNKNYKIPCIIVCLLFCCPFIVYADTSLTISSDSISSFNKDRIDILISYADNMITSDPTYNFYYIERGSSLYAMYLCRATNSPTFSYQFDNSRFRIYFNYSFCGHYRLRDDASEPSLFTSSSNSSRGSNYSISSGVVSYGLLAYGGTLYPTLYSSDSFLPFVFNSPNNEFSSFTLNLNDKVPSLYNLLYPPYIPPADTTPLLTEFFSLCINKLIYITDYFTSDYLFLSIFVIFILISFIYFLKRRFYL